MRRNFFFASMGNLSRLIFVLFFIMFIGIGCSGSDEPAASSSSNDTPNEVAVKSGQFIDCAVQGLTFQTTTQSGTTDATGTFQYQKGEYVSFRVGNIDLGQAKGADIITPLDLVTEAKDTSHPKVINICRFLQSLDDDGDLGNGITITNAVKNTLKGRQFNFSSLSEFGSQLKLFIDTLNAAHVFSDGLHEVVSEEAAQNHLEQSIHGPGPFDTDNDGDGYTENQGDCNDNNSSIHPGATEIGGDGIDQDCDGLIDEADSVNTSSIFWTVSNDRHIAHYRIDQTGSFFNCFIIDWTQTNRTGLGTIEFEPNTLFGSGSILNDNYYFDDGTLMPPIPWILSDNAVGSLGYDTVILVSSSENTMQSTLNYKLYDTEKKLIETGTSSSTWTRYTATNDLSGTWNFFYTGNNIEEDLGHVVIFHEFDRAKLLFKNCNTDNTIIVTVTDNKIKSFPEADPTKWEGTINEDGHEISGTVTRTAGETTVNNSLRLVKISDSTAFETASSMTLQGKIFGQNFDLAGDACGRIAIEGSDQSIGVAIPYNHLWLRLIFRWDYNKHVDGPVTLDVVNDNLFPYLEGYLIWENKNPNKDNPIDEEYDEINAISGSLTIHSYDGENLNATYDFTFTDNTNLKGEMIVSGFYVDYIE